MHENIIPLTFSHYEGIFKLDRCISGENREKLIRNYLENGLVYQNNGVVEGYYLTNLGQGDICATSINAGIELLSLKYALNDKAVLPSENENAIQFLKENGFEESRIKGKRMIYGEELAWVVNGVFSRIGGNLTVFPYFALAAGFLTGKYRSEADFGKSVRGQGAANYLNEQGLSVLQALDKISAKHYTVPAAVALAWLPAQLHVGGPLASATSPQQLKQILSAASLVLDEEDLELLDVVSKYNQ